MCSKKCLSEAVAYIVAGSHMGIGLLLLFTVKIEAIVVGLVFLNLGLICFVGLMKNKAKLVLGFMVVDVIILVLITLFLLYMLIITFGSNSSVAITTLTIGFAITIVFWIMLGVMWFHYKEMAKNVVVRPRSNGTVRNDGRLQNENELSEFITVR